MAKLGDISIHKDSLEAKSYVLLSMNQGAPVDALYQHMGMDASVSQSTISTHASPLPIRKTLAVHHSGSDDDSSLRGN